MTDKEQLKQYLDKLVEVLNDNGFRFKTQFHGQVYENKYENDDFVYEEIAANKPAFNFLESRGLIRHDICYRCGKNPISNKYHFIEVVNKTELNICKNCHPEGNSSGSSNSGCMILLAFPIIGILISWLCH